MGAERREAVKRWAVPTKGPNLLDRDLTKFLAGRNVKIVDLTHEVHQGMPIWPGHQKPYMMVNQTHEQYMKIWGTEKGFEAHSWLISEHTGTHTDAVFEYVPGAPTLEYTPLEYYYGQAICLDVSHVRYPKYVQVSDLKGALEKHGLEIQQGDIVLLYTGHADRCFHEQKFITTYAGLDDEATEWLAELGVVNIGVDTLSIDHTDDDKYMSHMTCGKYQIVNTEVLANLGEITGKRVWYMGLPLRLRAGTGSPIRAIAFVPDA